MKITANSNFTETEIVSQNGGVDAVLSRKEFELIYNQYWKSLLSIAFSHTRDKALAEEIVQEVFVSLWERREEIKILSIGAYLATAVKFSVFKFIATQNRHRELLDKNYRPETIQLDESMIHARFLKEYLDGIIESLPEKCSLVFKYSRNDGLTNAEIAKKMDIAPKTVEAHLSKALKVLRASLRDIYVILLMTSVH